MKCRQPTFSLPRRAYGLIWLFHHIIDTKSLTFKEYMLMCHVWVKLQHIRCKNRYWVPGT